VLHWLNLKKAGTHMNEAMRKSKSFRNPDFLHSVVSHFKIDEVGTMFSKVGRCRLTPG
jgi:hypothetical protein